MLKLLGMREMAGQVAERRIKVSIRKHRGINNKKPIKVLIVDDEEIVRETLKVGLNKKDVFDVEEAENGKEALEEVARNKPDLILLDVTMPVMDGFQTYKRLKENPETKNIPVIFLTARPYEDIIQDMPIRADEYIEKPYELEGLYARINKIIGSEKK